MDKFKFWLISVAVLFVLFEVYQWVSSILLPLPLYVFAGAFLAIASNLPQGQGISRARKLDR